MNHPFKISVTVPVPKKVNMWVEQYYASRQVERYNVTYGEKLIRIERRLNEKQEWKILGANYSTFKVAEFATYMKGITDQIESKTKPPEPDYIHPKNA